MSIKLVLVAGVFDLSGSVHGFAARWLEVFTGFFSFRRLFPAG